MAPQIATSSPGNGTEAADDSVFTSPRARFAPTRVEPRARGAGVLKPVVLF
jgi:hypothetical protein